MVKQFKPKIIFFDIDDTLYIKHRDMVPESVFEALKQLKQKGILLAIATGRAIPIFPKSIQQLIQEVGIDIIVSINGQYVSVQGQCLQHFPLASPSINEITQYFQKHDIAYALMSDQKIEISHLTPEVEQAMSSLHLPFDMLTTHESLSNVYQVLAFYREQQHQIQLDKRFKVVRWHKCAVDILEVGSSKVKGIQYVLNQFNLDWSDTMAFGDGLNDMEMIQTVNFGIAMGNAHPTLKQVADYITSEHEQDGILKALQELGLVK